MSLEVKQDFWGQLSLVLPLLLQQSACLQHVLMSWLEEPADDTLLYSPSTKYCATM